MRSTPFLVLLVLTGLGCARHDPPGVVRMDFRVSPTPQGPLATFGGDAISASELTGHLQAMPPRLRARYASADQRKDYLLGMVHFDLLVQEALRQGLEKDPKVISAAKRMLVRELLQRELAQAGNATDAEIAAYYQAHKAEFHRAAQVRLAQIFLAVPKGNARALAKARATAKLILRKVKGGSKPNIAGFAELARHYAAQPNAPVPLNLRYVTLAELARRYGPPVAQAADRLQKPGEISEPVEAEDGLHLFQLLERTPDMDLPIASVKGMIATRLAFEHRKAAQEALLKKLAGAAHLSIDEKALSSLPLDLKAPARPDPEGSAELFDVPSQPLAPRSPLPTLLRPHP